MLTDLGKYDLLNLILYETMNEEAQANMVLNFTEALSGYLGENLSQYFKNGEEAELTELLNKEGVDPEAVINFYRSKIPSMDSTIEDLCLRFKRNFLLDVYRREVEKLRGEISSFDGGSADDLHKQIVDFKRFELEDWQNVLTSAEKDDWDRVADNLSAIAH